MKRPTFRSRFRDKCEVCGEWKVCAGYKGIAICQDCFEKTEGKIELKVPVQDSLFDEILRKDG